MYSQNNYGNFKCPSCGSFDLDYVDWYNFKCKKCGYEEKKQYEDIPHSDSYCPVVQSSGQDKILKYERVDDNE